MMPNISIPPLIPLPGDRQPTRNDVKDDLFATLFSPATPRSSPAVSPPPEEKGRPRHAHRHSRGSSSASTDSDFGSFVSVPSTEDPLSQFVSASSSVPFTPLQNFGFFEDTARGTQEKSKGVLDELLRNENDPLFFLRDATPQDAHPGPSSESDDHASPEGSNHSTPGRSRSPRKADEAAIEQPLVPIVSPAPQPRTAGTLDLLAAEVDELDWTTQSENVERSRPPLLTPSPPGSFRDPVPVPTAPAQPTGVLRELLDHAEDPGSMYLQTTMTESLNSSRTATPQSLPSGNEGENLVELYTVDEEEASGRPRARSRSRSRQRHLARTSTMSESAIYSPSSSPTRSPSLPPPPIRISMPEVQRTQSYFMPSSLGATSSFPTRWVSSLLSRPAPPPPPPPPVVNDPVAAAAAARVPITHGSPFAAHPYIPPSGAPGFAGDRAWDKGFQFDKENIERASVRLVGRKETSGIILTVAIADKIRPSLPPLKRISRSWTLLYSLDQHGISLNTLYTRCEAHTGGALVVMRDSNDAVFGAWVGDGIRQSKGAYYGSGESFLWKLDGERVRVFKWSGKNDYVALCEPEYISFGGGDGHYGLYLDDSLSDGSSAHCPTFENEPLCSTGPRQGEAVVFECVGLEVWGVS